MSSSPCFTVVGSELFCANVEPNGSLLGATDGTPGGTIIVQAGTTSGLALNPQFLANDHGILVFEAYDPAQGYELWQSDGTAANTLLAADIYPGGGSSSPSYLTVAGNHVFFSALDLSDGIELWSATVGTSVVSAGLTGPGDGVTMLIGGSGGATR